MRPEDTGAMCQRACEEPRVEEDYKAVNNPTYPTSSFILVEYNPVISPTLLIIMVLSRAANAAINQVSHLCNYALGPPRTGKIIT